MVRFDKFGNAITNIDIETFNDFTSGNKFKISVGNIAFGSLHKSYFEQDYTCITGSSGYLEFGYYKGNFQEKAGIKKGEAVTVRTAE